MTSWHLSPTHFTVTKAPEYRKVGCLQVLGRLCKRGELSNQVAHRLEAQELLVLYLCTGKWRHWPKRQLCVHAVQCKLLPWL
jgi:hypothetical protein